MTSPPLDALLQPFRITLLELKNHIVMAPMTRSFSREGVPGENVAAYYQRRAENDVGLILSEGTVIERPASRRESNVAFLHCDAPLAGWKQVVDGVHTAGRCARLLMAAVVTAGLLGGYASADSAPAVRSPADAAIAVAGQSEHRWTGVAVLADGRIAVNFPRWQPDTPISVGVLDPASGVIQPYPDARANAWVPDQGLDPATHWVCVQSVVAGPGGHLFVLDSGRLPGGEIVPGAPKLVRIDPVTNIVERTYLLDASIATGASYLNDVRFEASGRWGFITDSGAGALIVLDLETGQAWRRLAGHPSVMAEDVDVLIEGAAFRQGGQRPRIHADGIAVDGARGWVYWQALTARTLYRLPIMALTDPTLTEEALAVRIEAVAETGPSDGLEIDAQGRVYLTSLEHDAVRRWTPGGGIEVVARHPRLSWPDCLAWGPDGSLYVTATQIHRGPAARKPFELLRIPTDVVQGQ